MKNTNILLVGLIGCLIIWVLLYVKREHIRRGSRRDGYAYEGYYYPVEIPGHRPSLGDFLPTVGEIGTGSGGYVDEDDMF